MDTAYLEVGRHCYVRCVSCNVQNMPYKTPSIDEVYSRMQTLKEGGFKTIRFAGRDPLTNLHISEFIMKAHLLNFKIEIVSTFLTSFPQIIESVDTVESLKISLLGCGEFFRHFYQAPLILEDLLVKNINTLCRDRVIFNYTFMSHNGLTNFSSQAFESLKDFIDKIQGPLKEINFFSALDRSVTAKGLITKQIEFVENCKKLGIFCRVSSMETRKISKCTAHHKTMFVKYDGSVYPCCMAAGDLGQIPENQVYLGNIDQLSVEEMKLVRLEHLNNITCDFCTPKYLKYQM